MKKRNFKKVKVIQLLPDPGRRRILRELERGLGIPLLHDPTEIREVRQRIPETHPDLLILDLDNDRDAICELVRDIRNERLRADPYVALVTVTWQSDRETIRRSVGAGADDVLIMPISLAKFSERIDNLIDRRKNFVVTPTYLGPDRRDPSRQEQDALAHSRCPTAFATRCSAIRPPSRRLPRLAWPTRP